MYKEVVVSTSLKENTINIWDVNSCSNIFEFKENSGIQNGTVLVNIANRNDDYGLFPQCIYSIQSPKPMINAWKYGKPSPLFRNATNERMNCLCASADGVYLFGGSCSGKIYVWCISNGELLNIVDAHYKSVNVIRCLPDMGGILTGGDDGLIREWSMCELIGGLEDVNHAIKPIWTSSDHSLGVTDLAIRSGIYLISSSKDKTVRLWNLLNHHQLTTITTPSIPYCLCLSHHEQQCFVGSGDGTIYIIDLTKQLEQTILAGSEGRNGVSSYLNHHNSVLTLAITGDDSKLISGGSDGVIFVWDIATMQVIREYKGGNATAKANAIGSKSKENENKSIVFLQVIPYPSLLFENDNLLYPMKPLKKYCINDMKSFEFVMNRTSVQNGNDDNKVQYVGSFMNQENQAVALPSTEITKPEEGKSDIEKENKELKEMSVKYKEVAERMYQQLLSMQEMKK